MSIILRTSISLVFIFFSFYACSQSLHAIKIIDQQSKQALENVFIDVDCSGNPTISYKTNKAGIVILSFFQNCSLVASHIGYQKRRLEISSNDLANDTILIMLLPNSDSLMNVTVTQSKFMAFKNQKLTYFPNNDTSMMGKQTIEAFNRLPFFSILNGSKIQFKNGSETILFLMNGRKWGLVTSEPEIFLQNFPLENFEKIEIDMQPGYQYTKDGISVVVNLITRNGFFKGKMDILSASYNSLNEFSLKNLTIFQKNQHSFQVNLLLENEKRYLNTLRTSNFKDPQAFPDSFILNTNSQTDFKSLKNIFDVSYSLTLPHKKDLIIYGSMGYVPFGSNTNAKVTRANLSSFEILGNSEDVNRVKEIGVTIEKGDYGNMLWKFGLKHLENTLVQSLLQDIGYFPPFVYSQQLRTATKESTFFSDIKLKKWKILTLDGGLNLIYRSFSYASLFDSLPAILPSPDRNTYRDYSKNKQVIASSYIQSTIVGKKLKVNGVLNFDYFLYDFRVDQNQSKNRVQFNILPNVAASYKITNQSSVELKLKRTIYRPSGQLFSPLYDAKDPSLLVSGSQLLKPQIENSIKLSYYYFSKDYGTSIWGDVGHVWNNNQISKLISVQRDTFSSLILSPTNLGFSSTSLTIGIQKKITENLRLTLSDWVSKMRWRFDNVIGIGWLNTLSLNFSYQFTERFLISGAGFFNSKEQGLQGKSTGLYKYTFNANYNFKGNRTRLMVLAENPFQKKFKRNSMASTTDFSMNTLETTPFRIFSIQFNFSFGELRTQPKPLKRVNNQDLKKDN